MWSKYFHVDVCRACGVFASHSLEDQAGEVVTVACCNYTVVYVVSPCLLLFLFTPQFEYYVTCSVVTVVPGSKVINFTRASVSQVCVCVLILFLFVVGVASLPTRGKASQSCNCSLH